MASSSGSGAGESGPVGGGEASSGAGGVGGAPGASSRPRSAGSASGGGMTAGSISPLPIRPSSRSRSRTSLTPSVGLMPIIAENADQQPPLTPTRLQRPRPASLRPRSYHAGMTVASSSRTPSSFSQSAPSSPTRPTPAQARARMRPVSTGSAPTVPARWRPEGGVTEEKGPKKPWWEWRGRGSNWWYGFVVLMLVIVAAIVGLAVGLTLGLRNRNTNSPSPALPAANVFPAGSYAFTAALTNFSTACTSNNATWRCYPYQAYSPTASPATNNASLATFYWIIVPVNSFAYAISSTNDPFAPSFANLTMTLIDGNQFTERYVFHFSMKRSVVPSTALDSSNRAATCDFDDTVFSATLWTRMAGELGNATAVNSTMAAAAGTNFGPWPGRVEITQVQAPGPGVPTCVDYQNHTIGNFARPSGGDSCSCRYANYNLSNSTMVRRTWHE